MRLSIIIAVALLLPSCQADDSDIAVVPSAISIGAAPPATPFQVGVAVRDITPAVKATSGQARWIPCGANGAVCPGGELCVASSCPRGHTCAAGSNCPIGATCVPTDPTLGGTCPSPTSRPPTFTDTSMIQLSGFGAIQALWLDHRLSVRALAIRSANGNTIVMASVDVVGFNALFADEVRMRVGLSRGIPPENVMVTAIHTHQAPRMKSWPGKEGDPDSPAYVRGVADQTVAAIEDALGRMRPAALRFARGSTHVGAYRRTDFVEQGCTTGGVSYPGPYDATLDVLEAVDAAGATQALVFFHGVHSLAAPRYWITPGFIGYARDHLERVVLGDPSGSKAAIFMQGFGGDINESEFPTAEGQPSHDWEVDLGMRLSSDVAAARASATYLAGDVVARASIVYLPVQQWTGDAAGDPAYRDALPTEIQMFQIGTPRPGATDYWRLVASAHELTTEWGPLIRELWSDVAASRVSVAGYANAVESYVPSPREIAADRDGTCGADWRYEGWKSFDSYRLGKPNWSEGDLLGSPGKPGIRDVAAGGGWRFVGSSVSASSRPSSATWGTEGGSDIFVNQAGVLKRKKLRNDTFDVLDGWFSIPFDGTTGLQSNPVATSWGCRA